MHDELFRSGITNDGSGLAVIEHDFTIEKIEIEGLSIRTAFRQLDSEARPLLIFNGIGANLEIFLPFMKALDKRPSIIFDAPGVGESDCSSIPMRFPSLARFSAKILDHYNIANVDILGVSWGGALAQVFARDFEKRTCKVILAATSTGSLMVPAKPSVLLQLSNPRRYFQKGFMSTIAHSLYGGIFRHDPEKIHHFSQLIKPAEAGGYGYYSQLFAGWGWTSIHWLHKLKQPVLILAGSDDPIIPLANGRLLQSRLPNAHLEIINCGHLLLFTQIEAVIPIIQKFLDD